MASHTVKAALCPYCGYFTDRASNARRSERGKPVPGDVSVCLNCGSPGIFANDLTVRRITEAERDGLADDKKRALANALLYCITRGPLHPKGPAS
jgi:hypothetical protein